MLASMRRMRSCLPKFDPVAFVTLSPVSSELATGQPILIRARNRAYFSGGSIAGEPYQESFLPSEATNMKCQKIKVDRVVGLAVAVGAEAMFLAWELPDHTAELPAGWWALTGMVSRFPCSRPQAPPGLMNELRRSSIDEWACGQDAVGVIHHVCSASVCAANPSLSWTEGPMKDDVFISYRKSDSSADARLIADRINRRFGAGTAFFDNQSIELGTDFRRKLWRSLAGCRVVVAVVGPDWVGTLEDKSRRIDQKDDFVRTELEFSLRERLRVIPILV
ncbi:MAG: toll/interleukin-1 receptor domain-containing protein, partial [Actinoplanes sp.]